MKRVDIEPGAQAMTPVDIELKVLRLPIYTGAVVSLLALIAVPFTGSQAILLDGFFNLVYLITGIFTYRVGRLLRERGHGLDIRRPRLGDPLPDTLAGHAGAVIFGGPMSANDPDDFIKAEIDWIDVPLKEEKPFLGLCLGAQMLAKNLGGRVWEHPDGRAEIGYFPLLPTKAGEALSTRWGVAWRATHFRSELRYVVLKHWLDGLPESTASMWRSPYTGADFEVSYENLLSSDVYRSRARGLQASARAQALLGRTPFALAEAWFNYGTRLGPLFLLGGARGVYVTEQNLVSRWLLGGSFDAQGAQALFGHPFAEYRVTRAVTGLIRLDLEATRVLSFGLRGAAAAMSEGNHHGEAAVVTLDWQSLVLSAGLGVPDLKSARWHAFATVMVATFL